ncbi:MAG: PPC domain-containing protein [Acetobacteraceae bacterium]|nr:PPC domain-containing protein [Acetobacteraceae bacterium]
MGIRFRAAVSLASAVFVVAGLLWLPSVAAGGKAGFELVVSLPVAEGPEGAMVDRDVVGDTPHGPQALAVGEDGTIYIADSIQRQVLAWRDGALRCIPVPEAPYVRDMAATGGHIYLLDWSDRVFDLDAKGRLLRVVPLPRGMSCLEVHRLVPAAGRPGEIVLWCQNYLSFPLDGLPAEVDPELWGKKGLELSQGVFPARAPGGAAARALRFSDQNRVDLVDGLGRSLGRVEPVGGGIGSALLTAVDSAGRAYVLVEEVGELSPTVQVELSLRVLSPAGAAVGAVRLPLEDMVNVPHKPVEVTPAGEVYCLVPGREAVSVYRATPGASYHSRLRKPGSAAPAGPPGGEWARDTAGGGPSHDEAGTAAVYYGKFKGYPIPQDRAGVRSRALQCCDYAWTWYSKYDYLPNGTPRSSTTATKPSHLVGLANGSGTTAIPYCWGGWDSPWTKSDNWQWNNFGDALTKYTTYGPLMGNVGCTDWYSGSCGLDCAGFVAAASDAYYCGLINGDYCYKPGTSRLQADGKVVSNAVGVPSTGSPNYTNLSGMQPMSFFVNSGHVMFYYYRLLDGSGMRTLESTVAGTVQACKRWSRTWSELSGYYCRDWWDRVTGDDFTVAYTSKTGKTVLQGAQVYYKFQAAGSSTTVTVTASSGDPDLYVYNSSYGYITKATNVGSDSITFSTTPGAWYYAKVHAWSDCTYSISW